MCSAGVCSSVSAIESTPRVLVAGPVQPEDVTSEVWDYVFMDGPMPSGSGISSDTLAAMRREFEFWYPWDLRVRPCLSAVARVCAHSQAPRSHASRL